MSMYDLPITTQELFHLHQIRIGKSETKQPRSEKYRNPAIAGIRFEKEKAGHKDPAENE